MTPSTSSFYVWLSLLVALTACGPRAAPVPEPTPPALEPAPTGRLGDTVRPIEVFLELDIDPQLPSFRGEVAIDVAVSRDTRSVWLHAQELSIHSAQIHPAGAEPIVPASIESVDDVGLLGLHFDAPVRAGRAQLQIEFSGQFRDVDGLFKQKHAGQWYVYSDLEPVDARRAFPCFDDPRFKVPWSVSLIVPEPLVALSNMPASDQRSLAGNFKRVDFLRTTPLSSYLVAAAVGPFEIVEGATDPVPVRVIAPRGLGQYSGFALDAIPPMLRYLESYFGMSTPYPKLDFVAVPRFAGAMENPGLITVAAGILVIAPQRSSEADREFLAGVIAHELAHLWFGDLVTMQWWDDLWLNEAFATWMSNKVLVAWNPALANRVHEVSDVPSALREDRWPRVRSIKEPIASESLIARTFDVLTYRKGGAIVAMVEALAGDEAFARAMRKYVEGHAFSTAVAGDLTPLIGARPADTLQTYLTQPGVPVVSMELSCEASSTPAVRLSQAPYRLLSAPRTESDARRWSIPVCVAFGAGKNKVSTQCTVLDAAAETLELGATECPRWLRPNPDGAGYYYAELADPAMWAAAIANAANESEASWLVEAVDAQLQAGRLDPAAALRLLRLLARRGFVHTTNQVARLLLELDRAIDDRSLVASEVETALGQSARRAGLVPRPDEPRSVTETRGAIVAASARVGGDVELRREAQRLTARWLANKESPALLGLTLRVAALGADETLYASLEKRLRRDSSRRVQIAVASALGSFEDAALTRRALELLIDPDLAWQTRAALLGQLLLRREAQSHAVGYLLEHAADLGPELLAELPAMASSLCSAEHRDAIAALLDTRTETPDEQKRRTLAEIDQCAALRSSLGGSSR